MYTLPQYPFLKFLPKKGLIKYLSNFKISNLFCLNFIYSIVFLFLFLALVVRDKETGESKGYGFVTFENPKEAKDAINGADGAVCIILIILVTYCNVATTI